MIERISIKRTLHLLALSAVLWSGAVPTPGAATYAYIPDYEGRQVIRIATAAPSTGRVAVGLSCKPYGAAVAPDGTYLLVTCHAPDALVLLGDADFDAAAPSPLVDGALVGNTPLGVTIDPTGSFAYVANSDDQDGQGRGTVYRIDTRTLDVGSITVGRAPWGIAALYDEINERIKVYVANHLDNTVTVISDDGTGTFPPPITVDVGQEPIGVAVSPDGRYAYVANFRGGGQGSVSVIRTSDDAVIQTIAVDHGPWGVAASIHASLQGANGYTFVSNSKNELRPDIDPGKVAVLRHDKDWDSDPHILLSPLPNVGVAPLGGAAPRNGRFAYLVNDQGTISKVSVRDDQSLEVTTIQVPEMDRAYALGAFIGGRPPAAPSGFTAEATSYDRIQLAWTDNSSDPLKALGVKIERRRKGARTFTEIVRVPAGTTTYRDAPLQSDTTFEYRIRAYNEAADSAYVTPRETEVTTEKGGFSWCFIQTLRH
ncbi:hypothetical protein [Desulfatitalea alkaliphila]|uniref:Fibronectin type-III domain-containing protein n=1 Tax=Desulfatitalea alkaliphila TaxID=2929485 RepID=A0AA41ULU4_9BACT|nr:hypothetical protein [Desulfatitalea alkaliphila]MCJ8501916.1 hypothetical protein [Desulfatitalea alkaliphila]